MYYNDKKLLRASQIAYFLIDESVIIDINKWYNENDVPQESRNYTLSEIYNNSETFRNSVYGNISNVSQIYENLEDVDEFTVLSRIESPSIRERVAEMYDIIDDIENDRYGIGSWKIRSFVWNDEMGTQGQAGNFVDGAWNIDNFSSSGDGLCAMVFETSENDAIVAFRGSDAMATAGVPDINNLLTDWIASDGDLAIGDQNATEYIA